MKAGPTILGDLAATFQVATRFDFSYTEWSSKPGIRIILTIVQTTSCRFSESWLQCEAIALRSPGLRDRAAFEVGYR